MSNDKAKHKHVGLLVLERRAALSLGLAGKHEGIGYVHDGLDKSSIDITCDYWVLDISIKG